ncbi:hypothetical protein CSKR_113944 [Clonorchis sinensis]|uniref:MD-2-related lipid-recognition domain-containing protein n=1 Tax=Clonorchis sinensis TaxID=79923 RepID=A0A419PPB8_CLOSI|nr:hypothetical protein CSKR_113944 [Clonorchis sinensis]
MSRNAGSTGAIIESVDVFPCAGEPCVLQKGTMTTFVIKFVARANAGDVFSEVRDTTGHLATIHLSRTDVCRNLVPQCPILAGLSYTSSCKVNIPDTIQSDVGLRTFLYPATSNQHWHANETQWTVSSTGAIIESVDVSPCAGEPCVLQRGVMTTFAIKFVARVDAGDVFSNVRDTTGHLATIHLSRTDVCRNLVPQCPILAGFSYAFSYKAMMPDIIPSVS